MLNVSACEIGIPALRELRRFAQEIHVITLGFFWNTVAKKSLDHSAQAAAK